MNETYSNDFLCDKFTKLISVLRRNGSSCLIADFTAKRATIKADYVRFNCIPYFSINLLIVF